MAITRFEYSIAWQKSMDMAVAVTDAVDNCKRFCFVDQVYRASVSVPSNIAEGFERPTKPDRLKYLVIAKGSCNETRSLLIFGKRKRMINAEQFEQLHGMVQESGKLIHAVMNSPYV
ncbi:MAG: four helix bundle protein [Flavobacteriales bacterium]|nr:four helix bundle protein [Flavobacteriales bacterium]